LLGVHIVGEGATELIHLGQIGLLDGGGVDFFADNIFNFPTLAAAYRVAALDVVNKRSIRAQIARDSSAETSRIRRTSLVPGRRVERALFADSINLLPQD